MVHAWGPEVVYRCECKTVRSHLINNLVPRCPACRNRVEILYGENWEEIESKLR